MQDRYAGDVGDFGKFALLRALQPGRSLGVCWYRCSGAGERNNDGRHVAYLRAPERFRALDPAVFDAMARVVANGRSIASLEAAGLLPDARYHGDEVPRDRRARATWFDAMKRAMAGCDLVFADMDNGFEWSALTPKCIGREEVRALRARGRALLLYHHQTRRKGGAAEEFRRFSAWLFAAGAMRVEAVRLRPYASRFYLLVDGDAALSGALEAFTRSWGPQLVEHHRGEPR